MEPASLRFGVFPCGIAGTPDGLATGPPDDLDQITVALHELAGDKQPWLIRMYVVWTGAASTASCLRELGHIGALPWDLDVVLSYKDGDVGAWVSFVRQVASEWGSVSPPSRSLASRTLPVAGTATSLVSRRHLSTA